MSSCLTSALSVNRGVLRYHGDQLVLLCDGNFQLWLQLLADELFLRIAGHRDNEEKVANDEGHHGDRKPTMDNAEQVATSKSFQSFALVLPKDYALGGVHGPVEHEAHSPDSAADMLLGQGHWLLSILRAGELPHGTQENQHEAALAGQCEGRHRVSHEEVHKETDVHGPEDDSRSDRALPHEEVAIHHHAGNRRGGEASFAASSGGQNADSAQNGLNQKA
mmetsp:Transcript_72734/g.201686  ORF Transcript_72734/g.201686 Transcript_72734/m.201686 type:complete len:221 (+) Transcript_72734:88-750(+)